LLKFWHANAVVCSEESHTHKINGTKIIVNNKQKNIFSKISSFQNMFYFTDCDITVYRIFK